MIQEYPHCLYTIIPKLLPRKSQGKIITIAVLTTVLVTGLVATTLSGSHTAEAKSSRKESLQHFKQEQSPQPRQR